MFVREVEDMNLKKKTKVKNKAFIKTVEIEIIFLRNVINHLDKVFAKMKRQNEMCRKDEIDIMHSIIWLTDLCQETERKLVTYLDHYKF